MKHQGNCYRNIGGKKYTNYADLIMGEVENAQVIQEARATGRSVRKIKHPEGYYQLFLEVSNA